MYEQKELGHNWVWPLPSGIEFSPFYFPFRLNFSPLMMTITNSLFYSNSRKAINVLPFFSCARERERETKERVSFGGGGMGDTKENLDYFLNHILNSTSPWLNCNTNNQRLRYLPAPFIMTS